MVSIENLKNLKDHTSYKKIVLSIISRKCENKDKKIFKGEDLIEMLKILGIRKKI